jgi:hypothetical protein
LRGPRPWRSRRHWPRRARPLARRQTTLPPLPLAAWRLEPLEVEAEQPNDLIVVLSENLFRPYRGRSQEFVAVVKLNGGAGMQSVSLEPDDFKTSDGEAMSSWKNIDLLSVRAYYENSGTMLGSKNWAGGQPRLRKLWWRGADGLSP